MGTDRQTGSGMDLAAGIGSIIGLAILFFILGLLCYCLCCIVAKKEGAKDEESEAWTAKNYYDPLPTAISPPEAIFQPSLYSFKILNGAHPNHIPHAVINPAVLQYPPGHVLEDRTNYSSQPHPSRSYSRSSSKVSPTNIPLVQSDVEEVVHTTGNKRNGYAGRQGWSPS
ncbi:uncharacterized protein LOC110853506 [Folsomia candida]|uniref:Uncharacterized protein n=1 Tax=Folsomia candida TaxID=158441 RepID=A0A226E0W1_FOLCA|nr:uncharacterized protein LOC110853506 [Folsomia candida]OXA50908.1 hypothetical protein Fcan01_13912 [Folsomia candida]